MMPRAISGYYKSRTSSTDKSNAVKYEADKKIQNALCKNIGTASANEYHLFAIDVTPNKRPYAKKLADRGFVHVNETVTGKKPVAIGHKYSCLSYLTQEKHWALPLSIKRVHTSEKDTIFGINQWCEALKDSENGFNNKISIGVFDSAYSNAYGIYQFVSRASDIKSAAIFIARLRSDRVLMRPGDLQASGLHGRPAIFNKNDPFRLHDATSWGAPYDTTTVQWITKRGKQYDVEIKVWTNLRMRGHHDCPVQTTPLTVVRIAVCNQQDGKKNYKHPLWLVMVGTWPEHWPINLFWSLYRARFDIEHFFRFAKQRLLMDVYQTPDSMHEENWMQFVTIAYHQLFHARTLAKNFPKPWEPKVKKNPTILSPSKVQRDMWRILRQLPKITTEVKPRGIPAGRKPGEAIGARPSMPVVCKSKPKPIKLPQIRIIWQFKNGAPCAKPQVKYDGLDQSAVPDTMLTIIKKLEEVCPLSTAPP